MMTMCVKKPSVFRQILNNFGNLLNSNSYFIGTVNPSKSRSLEEKVGLPPKPKRPLTPYFKYMQQMRPVVSAENPKASITEVVKLIASKWKTVDNEFKKKLEDEYKKEQISYIEKCTKYNNKLTDTQKDDLKHMKHEIQEAKERRELKKRLKELGKPKKPASAFFRFLIHEKSISPPPSDMAYIEWIKKLTEKWSRLPEAEKDKYKNEAKSDLEKYKQEFSKWENKMIRLGHIDLVRQSSLIDPEIKLKHNTKGNL